MSTPDSNKTKQAPAKNTKSAKKSNGKGKIVAGIAAIVAVLFLGVAALGYFVWYQNPQKVLTDTFVGLSDLEEGVFTGQYAVQPKDTSSDVIAINATVEGEFNEGAAALRINGTITPEGSESSTVDGELRAVDNAYYGKVKNFSSLLAGMNDAESEDAEASNQLLEVMFSSLDDQWIELSAENIGEATSDECQVAVIDALRTEDNFRDEIADAYKTNMFIVVDDKLGSKNGNLGYEISIDTDTARQFAEAVNDTGVATKYEECADTPLLELSDDTAKQAEEGETTVEVWVSRWTHQLRSVSVQGEDDDVSGTMTLDIEPKDDVTVDAPEDAQTFEEVQ